MLKSFRRDCNAQSDNVNIVLHFDCNIQAFRPHRMHGVQRCGLLSQRVCMSLCLCVWWCLADGYRNGDRRRRMGRVDRENLLRSRIFV